MGEKHTVYPPPLHGQGDGKVGQEGSYALPPKESLLWKGC